MINIYDSVNQLAQDLTKTDQYKAVKDAVKAVQEDSESAAMFKKINKIQAKIMQAQQAGQPFSYEDQKVYRELNSQVQNDEKIIALLESEQKLYDLISEIQITYTKPINDLYEGLKN